MRDRRPTDGGDPETRRAAASGRRGPGRQRGFVERATAHGHSGVGADSVRPHLRDQLRLKSLLPTPYPTPDYLPELSKDEHHR